MKVYCKNCKKFVRDWTTAQYVAGLVKEGLWERCRGKYDTYYEKTEKWFHPSIKNKNNDCKDYEKK